MGELDLAPAEPREEGGDSPPVRETLWGEEERAPVRTRGEKAGWLLLGTLLAATFVGALTFDRAKLPLSGDEATYALQAASLVHDFDLAYTKADSERFVDAWRSEPDGLILQSLPAASGEPGPLVYGKPPLYALATAPFVALAPVRGGVIANALFLALAALLAARALRRSVGGAAPLWVAVFLFASLAFANVFWGEVDLFLLAATAMGYALVYGASGADPHVFPPGAESGAAAGASRSRRFVGALRRRPPFSWLGAGALLAIPVVYRPVYAVLWIPVLLAAFGGVRARRTSAVAALLLGGLALAGLSAGLQRGAGGDWTAYGGERRGLYGSAARRAVDLEKGTWSRAVSREAPASPLPGISAASWFQPGAAEPRWSLGLLGWSGFYALAGRNLGLLPYFLPLLLGFTAYGGARGRWAIPLAVLLGLAAFLVLRPFNVFGGGPYGDRYFLALYPALWFVAARPGRVLPAVLTALGAAPFLYLLWLHPRAYPLGSAAGFRHGTPVAARLLPWETTQQGLPGAEAAGEGGLWVKFLDSHAWATNQGRMRIAGAEEAEILVATPQPLDALHLEFGARAPSKLEVDGRELRPLMLRSDGGVLFAIPLGRPVAVHPTWWSPYDHTFYRFRFRLPGAPSEPLGFRLRPAHALMLR